MERKIVVVLRSYDRVEEMIPYLEDLARPGVKVTFLVSYPLDPSLYRRDHWVVTESPQRAMLAGKDLLARYSWKTQKGLAEERVSSACQCLEALGAEVSVDLWTGNLASLTASYSVAGTASLLMLKLGNPLLRRNLLSRTLKFFCKGYQPSFRPALLCDLGRGIKTDY